MFTYIWLRFVIDVGKYSVCGAYLGKMIYVKSYTALHFREYEIAKFPDTYTMDFYGGFYHTFVLKLPQM